MIVAKLIDRSIGRQINRSTDRSISPFSQTLSQGMLLLEEEIKKLDGKLLSGEVIFKLYDTYGFPVDMTSDFARENSLEVDIEGYEDLKNCKANSYCLW